MYRVVDRVAVAVRDFLDRWLGLQVQQRRDWAADTVGHAPKRGRSMVCSRCDEARVEIAR